MRTRFLTLRPGLRAKILLLSALTPAVLAGTVLFTVHRNVRAHVDSTSIHENLEHSATVFENLLGARLATLGEEAAVIAREPRFLALLSLPGDPRDRRFLATVKNTAEDYHRILPTDRFEVYDRNRRLLATAGGRAPLRQTRSAIVGEALAGRAVRRAVLEGEEQCLVVAVPVRGDHQIVGALVVGTPIDGALAEDMKARMLSEITFLAHGRITGTTLRQRPEIDALLQELSTERRVPAFFRDRGVLRIAVGSHTYLTVIRPLPGAAEGTAQAYVMQRSHDPETAFLAQMQSDMLGLGAVGMLIALVAGWLFSSQITRPVLALVRGARAMEDGDFEAPVEVRNRDELGYLAERFRVMRERERAYVHRLREAARVKSEFINVASHELRTPISVISGYGDLIADGSLGDVTPRQRDALRAIRARVDQLTRIADEATQMAQLRGDGLAFEPRETPLAPVIERAISAALASAPGRSVRVVPAIDPAAGSAWVDPERLTDVFTRVLTNGIRFTPDGGTVTVAATGDDDTIVFEVRDTGVGIPADRIDQIFEPGGHARDACHHHSSTHLEFNSAGLGFGLAIARAVVEAHGGSIHADSREGSGTTIRIRLPRDARRDESRAEAA